MSIADLPWRGPSPRLPGDPVAGRERDAGRVETMCRDRDIIVITAESGVGKSSFLDAGLLPRLQELGATILPPRPNGGEAIQAGDRSALGRPGWAAILQRYDELREGRIDPELLYRLAASGDLVAPAQIEDLLNDPASPVPIVVFDQFEELLRYGGRLGNDLMAKVKAVAHDWGVTHIVAARSEYADKLRPLEGRRVNGFRFVLDEITDADTIRQILTADAQSAGITLDPDVVSTIQKWWTSARQQEHADSGASSPQGSAATGEIGLLHLNAMLWELKGWAEQHVEDETRIRGSDLAGFAASREQTIEASSGYPLLSRSLVEYVRRTVMDRVTLVENRPWPNGPRLMLARVARLLSSSGYKVPQSFSSLLSGALSEELSLQQQDALTRATDRTPDGLARQLTLAPAGIALSWDDPDGTAVVKELVASLTSALDSAAEQNILRRFPRSRDTIYELVHDGMAGALNEWAEGVLNEKLSIIGLITERNGQPVSERWSPETVTAGERSQPSSKRLNLAPNVWVDHDSEGREVVVIEDIAWIGNAIRDASFERLRFVRCSFSGSVFDNVRLRNVTFTGCRLNGVAFHGGSELQDVMIEGTDEGDEFLDTLTLRGTRAAHVTFSRLASVTGLFLHDVRGGPWVFDDVDVSHLVVSGAAGVGASLLLSGSSRFEHVTLDGALAIDRGNGSAVTLQHVTNRTNAPLDALLEDEASA